MDLPEDVVGVLLAGGRSSRMGGGDKCLLPLGGQPMLAHIIDRLRPQVSDISSSMPMEMWPGLRRLTCR